MVEKKYVRSALTFAALAAHNQAVEAQRFENNAVCGFNIQATAFDAQNVGYIRDNIAGVGVAQDGLFYISENGGRLYSPDGARCGFDPYLECSTETESEIDRSPFGIEGDGTITFQGEREFYLCARGAFQSCDALGDVRDCDTNSTISRNRDDLGDEPRIYPPVGTTSNRQRVFENCTITQLVASQCRPGEGTFTSPTSAKRSARMSREIVDSVGKDVLTVKRQHSTTNNAIAGNLPTYLIGGSFLTAIALLL